MRAKTITLAAAVASAPFFLIATEKEELPVREGIWISRAEVMTLPMSGPAWEQLLKTANRSTGKPNLSDNSQNHNVYILAKALVYARTSRERYRREVRQACMEAMTTEDGGRTLALARELAAYVISADLVGLEPAEDLRFCAWLRETMTENLSNRTLVSTQEDRPNNWGLHAGASRAAAAVYLKDKGEIEKTADVFRGFLGDRNAHSDFDFKPPMSWHPDEKNPIGINPKGAIKNGKSIDGAIPDDMRRGGGFQFPPNPTGYPWEGLQGALVMAEILNRQGYDTWNWSDQALLRAVKFLYSLHATYPDDEWDAHGDDEWQLWLINYVYGTSYPVELPARHGKNIGWTDWTHDRSTRPYEK